jgi:hypothetical protein
MKVSRLLLPLIILVSVITAQAESSSAQTYQIGDKFVGFKALDQHEKAINVSPQEGVRHLIVSFTMGVGKSANGFFEEIGAAYLEKNHAVFLANIYGMPGIGRMFALPKMKKYPHQIVLGDDEHLLDRFPSEDNKLTMISFDAEGTITAIRFLDPKKDLKTLF